MFDMSGGLIKLGDVCNVNTKPKLGNFEVKIPKIITTLVIPSKSNRLWFRLLQRFQNKSFGPSVNAVTERASLGKKYIINRYSLKSII
jgi:hypothetical protein